VGHLLVMYKGQWIAWWRLF